jgi:glutamyl-tRNA synthetase
VGVTRLAPSPTGALHLGNARTFLINWALARQNGWRTILRIEDLDTPRIKPGVIDLTVNLLEWLGITWDGEAIIQSHRREHHLLAMSSLAKGGYVYPCTLTRREIEAASSAPQEGSGESIFPASLRPGAYPSEFSDDAPSWRFATPQGSVMFVDAVAGNVSIDPSRTIGDFIVWTRREANTPGQAAYQLAVVVDDADGGVSDVVRGDDLLDSAARQALLYRALGLGPHPRYWHVPLVVGADGRRLAKRHGDTRLDVYRAGGTRAERVIGLVAYWCGVVATRRELSAAEFAAGLDITTLPKGSVVFGAQDHDFLVRA